MKEKHRVEYLLSNFRSAIEYISTTGGSRSKVLAEAFYEYIWDFVPPSSFIDYIPPECEESFKILSTELSDYTHKKIEEERQKYREKGFIAQWVMNSVNSKCVIYKFHHTRAKRVISAILNIVIELEKLLLKEKQCQQ